MNKNNFRYSLVYIALGCPGVFLAQNNIAQDSSKLEVRYLQKNFADQYRTDDFNYEINDSGGINLVQQILEKFFGWLNKLFGVNLDFIDYRTLELIVYSLMALGALYLLIKFLKDVPVERIFRQTDASIENFNFLETDISEVNFDTLIQEAFERKNYRLATRYLYLKSLKLLAAKNVIEWHFDKTNSDYLNEITQAETRNLFKRISYIYDYVWYGEFALDQKMYDKNLSDFLKLNAI